MENKSVDKPHKSRQHKGYNGKFNELLHEHGYSLQTFWKNGGIPRATAYKVDHGEMALTLGMAKRVAEKLGISMSELAEKLGMPVYRKTSRRDYEGLDLRAVMNMNGFRKYKPLTLKTGLSPQRLTQMSSVGTKRMDIAEGVALANAFDMPLEQFFEIAKDGVKGSTGKNS